MSHFPFDLDIKFRMVFSDGLDNHNIAILQQDVVFAVRMHTDPADIKHNVLSAGCADIALHHHLLQICIGA